MKLLFIFLDGVGKGDMNENNPFFYYMPKSYEAFSKHGTVKYIDACLEVDGIPQSATGQVSIYSGVNAAKEVGFHINGQITPSLRKIIDRRNIFQSLMKNNLKVDFANVYRDEYLLKILNDKNSRMSVTSYMSIVSGIELKTVEKLLCHEGIYFDITNHVLKESGYDVPIFSARKAAENLINVLDKNHFVLFEHFKTDLIGHLCDLQKAIDLIKLLDSFILEIIKLLPNDSTLMITSDHGNIEDLSIKTHTKNKVPLLVFGKRKEVFYDVDSIVKIYPAIMKYFGIEDEDEDG